jgi:hypothetical protein
MSLLLHMPSAARAQHGTQYCCGTKLITVLYNVGFGLELFLRASTGHEVNMMHKHPPVEEVML